MPIVIGAKRESDFEDPIGLLTDCHRRIEMFLSVLATLTRQARGGPLSEEQRGALDRALRYFREAAPKHTADEEDSLFPRLRALDRQEVVAVIERVDALEQDHVKGAAGHAEVDRLGQAWLSNGALTHEETAQLQGHLDELSALYKGHIQVEEGEVFPLAARVLGTEDRIAIGGEMAARRRA